jgi:hypothetical protein
MMIRRRLVSFPVIIVVLAAASLSGCSKKRSAAVVLAKEHIDIAEPKPSPSPASSPADAKDGATESEVTTAEEMKPDEIEVDGYVMKKAVRGTSKDPRATKDEQWRVTVDIEDIGLSKLIQTDQAHYNKVKVGDRIRVVYSKGNYTGTVWVADIED